MVSEQSERTTFKKETEMTNREENGQKFTVKSRITRFSRRKFLRIKGKGLPMATDLLLKDSTNMGVRSIRGQRQMGRRNRMMKRNGSYESRLSRGKSGMHGRSPS